MFIETLAVSVMLYLIMVLSVGITRRVFSNETFTDPILDIIIKSVGRANSLFPFISKRSHDERVLLISKTLTQNYDALFEKERTRIDEIIKQFTEYSSKTELGGMATPIITIKIDRKLLAAFYNSVYGVEDHLLSANIIGERVKRDVVERLLEAAREIRLKMPVMSGDTYKDLEKAMVIGEYYVPKQGSHTYRLVGNEPGKQGDFPKIITW